MRDLRQGASAGAVKQAHVHRAAAVNTPNATATKACGWLVAPHERQGNVKELSSETSQRQRATMLADDTIGHRTAETSLKSELFPIEYTGITVPTKN